MSLADVLAADRRGIILRVLHDQGDFGLNDGVIQDALDLSGHKVSRDVVRTELSWLEEQGFVHIDKLQTSFDKATGLWVANLTQRGEEIATGRSKNPGVKRPPPKG